MLTKAAFIFLINNDFIFDYILKCNLFMLCKAEFSALLTSVSHDPSEIILLC